MYIEYVHEFIIYMHTERIKKTDKIRGDFNKFPDFFRIDI